MTVGHYVRIEPLLLPTIGNVAAMVGEAAEKGMWRLPSGSHSDHAIQRALSEGVWLQRVIVARESRELVGLCQVVSVDWRARHGELTVLLRPEAWKTGWAIEGVALFITEAFTQGDLRKLFVQVPPSVESNIKSSIGSLLSVEGRLAETYYSGGQYLDLAILSVSRSDWPFIDEDGQAVAPGG